MMPLNWPLWLMMAREAASSVGCMEGFNTSTAHTAAAFGSSISSAWHTGMVLLIMAIFSSSVGYMTIAASVIRIRRSNFTESNTATWLKILPVRSPHSLFNTARRKSAVPMRPFITSCASPLCTSFTAASADFLISGSFTMVTLFTSSSISSAIWRIFASSPQRVASAIPICTASFTASRTGLSSAAATAILFFSLANRLSLTSLNDLIFQVLSIIYDPICFNSVLPDL